MRKHLRAPIASLLIVVLLFAAACQPISERADSQLSRAGETHAESVSESRAAEDSHQPAQEFDFSSVSYSSINVPVAAFLLSVYISEAGVVCIDNQRNGFLIGKDGQVTSCGLPSVFRPLVTEGDGQWYCLNGYETVYALQSGNFEKQISLTKDGVDGKIIQCQPDSFLVVEQELFLSYHIWDNNNERMISYGIDRIELASGKTKNWLEKEGDGRIDFLGGDHTQLIYWEIGSETNTALYQSVSTENGIVTRTVLEKDADACLYREKLYYLETNALFVRDLSTGDTVPIQGDWEKAEPGSVVLRQAYGGRLIIEGGKTAYIVNTDSLKTESAALPDFSAEGLSETELGYNLIGEWQNRLYWYVTKELPAPEGGYTVSEWTKLYATDLSGGNAEEILVLYQ